MILLPTTVQYSGVLVVGTYCIIDDVLRNVLSVRSLLYSAIEERCHTGVTVALLSRSPGAGPISAWYHRPRPTQYNVHTVLVPTALLGVLQFLVQLYGVLKTGALGCTLYSEYSCVPLDSCDLVSLLCTLGV